MTVKDCIVFQGGYVKAYEQELAAKIAEYDREDSSPVRADLSEVEVDGPYLRDTINDDSLWFQEEQTVILDQVQEWKAADLNELVKRFQATETEWNLIVIVRRGEPLACFKKIMTQEALDYRVPLDTEDLAEWLDEWTGEHGAKLAPGVARQFAEYGAEDVQMVVDTIADVVYSNPGKTLKWGDILKQAGAAGKVPIFFLTKEIINGNKAGALEAYERLSNAGLHGLQMLGLIKNKYRGYALIVGTPNLSGADTAELIGGSPGSARWSHVEAKMLGSARITKALGWICDADRGLKGYQALDDETLMQVLIIRLTQQFRVARGK